MAILASSIYQDEISNLKHGLISIFNENFCKQILETVQVYSFQTLFIIIYNFLNFTGEV